MFKYLWILAIVLPATFLTATSVADGASPEQVQAAIDKARQYLNSKQANGNWEEANAPDPNASVGAVTGGQWGGLTAMSTYALLAAGESPAKLAQPIKFLEKADIKGVYALGFRAQIWHLVPPDPENRAALKRDGNILINAIHKESGMYDYLIAPTKDGDHSVSQYGVLGMWACAEEGLEVPEWYWKLVDSSWRKAQTDGGWTYGRSWDTKGPSIAMTAAGVATLFISRDELIAAATLDCKGNQGDAEIDKGIAWIAEHFKEIETSYRVNYTYYGIERIGAAGGLKYLGNINWYEKISDELIKKQDADGSWGGSLPETCYGLVFLARGRAPVLMNKLQYSMVGADGKSVPANWNQRPRDVYQFTKWCAKQLELGNFFNWQVVNLDIPVEEMHDAPILYITGDQNLSFTDAQELKLKTFVEQGGMIVFNADCGSAKFTDSAQNLTKKLFPQYEIRPLPADHLIFKNQQFTGAKWKSVPKVLGLSNGVREMIVILPNADPSRYWQAGMTKLHSMEHQLGADLVEYASDKSNLRQRGVTYLAATDPKIVASKTIKVARIKFTGNWDPEPGGWRRLAAIMHNQDKIDLDIQTADLAIQGALKGFTIADLTGTDKLNIDAAGWKQIKDFVDAGGTLIVDAAGGSSSYADDARTQLKTSFGAKFNDPLNASHVLFNQPAAKVEKFEYRLYAHKFIAEPWNAPKICGIAAGNRIGVFFSAEDITGGLVGEPVDGIIGYTPETATALMRAMVLYAAGGSKPN